MAHPPPAAHIASRLAGLCLGGAVLGTMSVAFVISFTAVVFNGPAAPFLAQGIAHGLLAAAVMLCVGTAGFTWRGTLCQPQDVTAVLIAGSMAGLVLPQGAAGGATAVTLVATASLMAGGALILAGRFRLSQLVRLMPYPVIAGFLAATGYLLVMGGIGMALKSTASILDPAPLLTPEALTRWGPWVLAGVALMLIERRVRHDLLLAGALFAMALAFYGVLAALGLSLDDAAAQGLLLGPFGESSFVRALDPGFALRADWRLVLGEMPMLVSLVALALLGAMLNCAGIEAATRRELDLERDLRATGRANAAAGLLGGLPGYPLIGETLLGAKLRLRGWEAAAIAAGFCLVSLVAGAGVLGLLPIGLFAAVIAYLGADLLAVWLWDQRKRLAMRDMAIILIILAVAATVGFLEALVMGCLVATVLFLQAYARLDVIRQRSTARHRRSRVERAAEDEALLADTGDGTVILELQGYLFFGTAHALRESVRAELRTPPRQLVLDLARVAGLDASAQQAVTRVAEDCAAAGVGLTLCAVPGPNSLRAVDAGQCASLDAALEQIEEATLRASGQVGGGEAGLSDLLAAIAADPRARAHMTERTLDPGGILVACGDEDRQIFLLRSGRIRAEVATPEGRTLRVALFAPGALIGELAFYAGRARTADLIAEETAEVVGLDLDGLQRDAPDLAAQLHRHAARTLALRLARTTAILRDAGL